MCSSSGYLDQTPKANLIISGLFRQASQNILCCQSGLTHPHQLHVLLHTYNFNLLSYNCNINKENFETDNNRLNKD